MRLLDADEPGPVIAENAGAGSPFLLLGDHAGNLVPRRLRDLGLPAAELARHIGWDIGVAGLGVDLASRLRTTFVRQRYSRLVIDCNRDPDRDDAFPAISDGTPIPGNSRLSPTDRLARRRGLFEPYHRRIGQELDQRAADGGRTVLVSLHSFTPSMGGQARPWRYGVLHRGDSAMSQAMLRLLRKAVGKTVVGDNQPYSMDGTDFTIPHHADGRGLDYLELEVRQDLLADRAGQHAAAVLLEPLLRQAAREIGIGV